MAFTNTLIERTVFGNKAVQVYSCLADNTSGVIATGMKKVDWISVTYKSMSTGATKFKINALTSGTASAGYVAVTGITSGDEFFIQVYGS